MHCISIRALHVSVSFICSSPSTFDGGRVWSVVLTQLRGIFLLEDTHCHRSCRFWTVYSRIMMTFKQTRLLSSLYLYTSAPCIRFIHLEPGTVYWDMTPPRKKKKESYYDEALHVIRFIHLYLGVSAWRRACLKRGALKNIWIVWQYYYIRLCIFLLVQNDGSLISEWHKYYSWTNPSS